MVVLKTKYKSGKIMKKKIDRNAYKLLEEQKNAEIAALPKETLIVLQELKIARNLAGNDATKRHQQVRKLRRWLRLRAESSFPMGEENFMRLWKGLYYCMYMSDKPLVQEQLAENLGKLLECFAGHTDLSIKFFGAFLNTMRNEYFGIDQWRIDKFYMLMRRMLRHMFGVLKSVNWSADAIQLFNEQTKASVLAEKGCAMGVTMHYMDIVFEELAKVAQTQISAEQVSLFVEPFVDYFLTHNDDKLVQHCRARIFNQLLHQSTLGREYQEKYEAWKHMGFPDTIDAVEKVEEPEETNNEEQDNELPLDPRAGNVDTYVPELPFDATMIVERLRQVILKEEMSSKRRKMLRAVLQNFETYQSGVFPLAVKSMPRFKDERETGLPLMVEKVAALEETEQELYGTTRKLKKLNKRQRRQLLKTLDLEKGKNEDYYEAIENALATCNKQDRLKEGRKTLMNGWIEEQVEEVIEKTPKAKQGNLKKKNKFQQRMEKLKARKQKLREEKAKKNAIIAEKQPAVVESKTAAQDEVQEKEPLEVEAANKTGWEEALGEGEVEYFVPSRKLLVKKRNEEMLRTLAKTTPRRHTLAGKVKLVAASPHTPGSAKRVKIALKHNTEQKPSDYIKQIRSSPNVPYDSSKKPGKGLLKPHSMPSPVDPFYAKRNSLKIKLNNTSF